jgi:hypothetical protein
LPDVVEVVVVELDDGVELVVVVDDELWVN